MAAHHYHPSTVLISKMLGLSAYAISVFDRYLVLDETREWDYHTTAS